MAISFLVKSVLKILLVFAGLMPYCDFIFDIVLVNTVPCSRPKVWLVPLKGLLNLISLKALTFALVEGLSVER